MSDADEQLIHTLLQGYKWLNEGVEIPAEQVPPLAAALYDAAIYIGRPKTIVCSRCKEPNKFP